MKGSVVNLNSARGMVAVRTELGDFSIFELLGGDNVEVGDEVSWKDDTALGSEILTNHSQGGQFDVFFQNHHVSESQLREQMLY